MLTFEEKCQEEIRRMNRASRETSNLWMMAILYAFFCIFLYSMRYLPKVQPTSQRTEVSSASEQK